MCGSAGESSCACLASSVGRGEWADEPRANRNAAPDGVYFTALPMRFTQNLSQVRRIGSHARKRRPTAIDRSQTAFVDERLELTRHIEHERTQHDGLRMNLQSTGGNLRDVQHLVDEVAQVGRWRPRYGRRAGPSSRRQIAVDTLSFSSPTNPTIALSGVRSSVRCWRGIALCRIRPRHFAIESLEPDDRSATCRIACRRPWNEKDAEEDDGGETEDPENDAQRLDGILVSDDQTSTGRPYGLKGNGVVGLPERRPISDDEHRIHAGEDRRRDRSAGACSTTARTAESVATLSSEPWSRTCASRARPMATADCWASMRASAPLPLLRWHGAVTGDQASDR